MVSAILCLLIVTHHIVFFKINSFKILHETTSNTSPAISSCIHEQSLITGGANWHPFLYIIFIIKIYKRVLLQKFLLYIRRQLFFIKSGVPTVFRFWSQMKLSYFRCLWKQIMNGIHTLLSWKHVSEHMQNACLLHYI